MKSPMERFTLVCKNWNQAGALFRAQYPVLEVKSGSVLSPPRGEPMARYLSAPTPAEGRITGCNLKNQSQRGEEKEDRGDEEQGPVLGQKAKIRNNFV